MANRTRCSAMFLGVGVSLAATFCLTAARAAESPAGGADVTAVLEKIGTAKGICAVLGLPGAGDPRFVTDLAAGSELLVYFQSPDGAEVERVREAADARGLLGTRIVADRGPLGSIHLAANLADAALVAPARRGEAVEAEVLRVLRPEGAGFLGEAKIVKPVPAGLDDWSHPYHRPDNNPQSADQIARAPYLTQFLAEPFFCPMPEVTVVAGGRIFKALGHIAHKANQNPWLNTLLCANAYNGTILWKRNLTGTFMIHRNAMIATPDTLYMGDEESCKLIDARTGAARGEIAIPPELGGPVWKWMAMEGGTLYALIGGEEVKILTQRSNTPGLGHWPWGMWAGHDYADPRTSFGFGRTFVAIDPSTKEIRWSHREDECIDSRGVCMRDGRIYFYVPEKFLACLDARSNRVVWKKTDRELLEAIGPNGQAQHYITGYATTTYIKCNDKYIFFAGPQRSRLVAVRAEDGALLWQKPAGNFQLVLRDDALYAAGPEQQTGFKLAYDTGQELAKIPMRRACTRATGSADSIFYRTTGGTVRIEVASNAARHIAPMRPPCQDGVIIAGGMLYWGPWMCGCQLSLYGHICLAPAGDFDYRPALDDRRFEAGTGDPNEVERFDVSPGDWPSFQNGGGTPATRALLPRAARRQWTFTPPSEAMPSAPVAAGGLVFTGDRRGVVRAIDALGNVKWRSYTGGAIYFPPAVAQGRVYAGSADGWVYAFEAATGRRLWRFRVGPAERFIPVYGSLSSTWPVAGGVVVNDGVVYAAAGIAHYDGTHVVALDAITGKPRWYNNTSGILSEKVESGISLQGNLWVAGDELQFPGGGIYDVARYDLRTGACRNAPHEAVTSRFQTAFYAYYPEYGQYVSLHHALPDGSTLAYDASYEGSGHSSLALRAPAPPGAPKSDAQTARRRGEGPKAVWEVSGRRFNSLIVAPGAVLAAGQRGDPKAPVSFLAAIDIASGKEIWYEELPAPPVKGGAAIDRDGRIVVSLANGQILCFAGAE